MNLRVSDVLGRGGVLSRRLSGFRERPQQVAMAEAVEAAFSDAAHLVVEAPTGVGKSLAYLVPAILGPVQAGQKVVIATNTIALQDQLLRKDVPLLASCLPVEFTVTKAVGRSNYLGLRRLQLALERAPGLLEADPEVVALRRIRQWAESGPEGMRQELDPPPRMDIWEQVQSETDNCLGPKCSTFQECFYQAGRRRMQTANLIVTNHALYCTHLQLKSLDLGILPEHDVLIVDEAHHFERVAQERFGVEVSRRQVRYLLNRLLGTRGTRGLFSRLSGGAVDALRDAARHLSEEADLFFGTVARWLSDRASGGGRYRAPHLWEDLVSEEFRTLSDGLMVLADAQETDEMRVELTAFAGRCSGVADAVTTLLNVDQPDLVYFAEADPAERDVRLAGRPLEVAPLLEREIFGKLESVVLTSATMAVGKRPEDLAYPAARLGCPDGRKVMLDSPFRYGELVQVHVPKGLPLPDDPEFEERAAAVTLAYVLRSGGGAFLLFTSYRALEGFWRRLAEPLGEAGYLLLKQGDAMDRATMLDRFRSDGNAVLFGTDSFWHGVDVPGSALRLVVLTRLPFPVPSSPLHEATVDRLRRAGRDPFRDFTLPEAVIRFRQGCGRLVRTETDEGTIVCLDRRVADRSYGRQFRSAFDGAPWDLQAEIGRTSDA